MKKGGMTLVDKAEASDFYSQMGPALEMSGGSAANTLSGFVSFGGTGAFIGKYPDTEVGVGV